ncbi:uncharacterized protein PFLUO_LOCUS3097 [Penicillium psychrofluorescens]|uniref:uncharacterized protein n=1 Tax=Penicillium psychrofluorescens TaxID=3158075 RepID=UPI003CCDC69B
MSDILLISDDESSLSSLSLSDDDPQVSKPTTVTASTETLQVTEEESATIQKISKRKLTISPSSINSISFMDSTEMDEMPDQATMMNFALPKVNHQGARLHDDNIDMWCSSFTDDSRAWNDLAVAETQYSMALRIREAVDWDCRRLGRRLLLLRRERDLYTQKRNLVRNTVWEGDDEDLHKKIWGRFQSD